MDFTARLIKSLHKEEVRFYKLYSSRIQTGDRKDLALFDHIRKEGDGYDEEAIIRRLYGDLNRNAYYRLRNRLTTELKKCMLTLHYQEDDHIHLLNQLSLARLCSGRGEHELALWFLRKAESKAVQQENYEILDLLYGEMIRLSHELLSINPEEYILKRKENQERIIQLRSIDDITAVLNYRLKITQTFSGDQSTVTEVLQRTLNEYTNDKKLAESPKFRFRIYNAVSQILLSQRDYRSLEGFLAKTYKEFEDSGLFNRNNHDTKLQMLTYLVNSLFKNDKTEESLRYTEVLHENMKKFGNLLYDKYEFFYHNALVINYSKLDKEKAIDILDGLLQSKRIRTAPFYEMFIFLNLAILHFDLHNVRESLKNIGKLNQLDSFIKADPGLRLKISVAELIIRYEAEDLVYIDYLLKKIRKEFRGLLADERYAREKALLHVISVISRTADLRNDKRSVKVMNEFLSTHETNTEDEETVIDYISWIKDKIG